MSMSNAFFGGTNYTNKALSKHWQIERIRILAAFVSPGASGLIDTLYILVDAHRQMATTMQEKPQTVSQLQTMVLFFLIRFSCVASYEALSISGQYLEKFRASKNQRGEAAMLLSLAESLPQMFACLILEIR